MNIMTHEGYAARVEYSEEDGCFVGHIAGIQDIVGFHGDSVEELRSAFVEAIEDYKETCEKLGRPTQKPFGGEVVLQIDPTLHAQAAALAEAQGKSLDAWAQEQIQKAVAQV